MGPAVKPQWSDSTEKRSNGKSSDLLLIRYHCCEFDGTHDLSESFWNESWEFCEVKLLLYHQGFLGLLPQTWVSDPTKILLGRCKTILQGHADIGTHVARHQKGAPIGSCDTDHLTGQELTKAGSVLNAGILVYAQFLPNEESWTRTSSSGPFPHL